MRLASTSLIALLLLAAPAHAVAHGGDLGGATPDTLYPALNLGWWRPTRGAGTYGAAPGGDLALWQGDWALGGGGTLLSPPPAAGAADALDNGAAIAHVTLRRRFALPGMPGAPPAKVVGEAGWQGLFPNAPGFVAIGLAGELPIRPGWLVLEGGVRGGPYVSGGGWLVDAHAGFQGRFGPAGLGLAWRHVALGGGRISNLTGPQATAQLAF